LGVLRFSGLCAHLPVDILGQTPVFLEGFYRIGGKLLQLRVLSLLRLFLERLYIFMMIFYHLIHILAIEFFSTEPGKLI